MITKETTNTKTMINTTSDSSGLNKLQNEVTCEEILKKLYSTKGSDELSQILKSYNNCLLSRKKEFYILQIIANNKINNITTSLSTIMEQIRKLSSV